MFRSTVITAIFLLFAIPAGFSQEVVNISGRVLDEENGLPIPYHPVFVTADDSLFLNAYYTNPEGYFMDSLFIGGISINHLMFSTFDCLGLPHDTIVYDLQTPIYVEFSICNDSMPVTCQADFIPLPQGPGSYTVSFLDASTGEHDQWYWDFGDSTYSQEPNPVHTYNSPGEYLVCLTISSSNGICNSTTCNLVIVFEEGCNADFTFTLDSLSSDLNVYHFTDLSTGNVDTWYWDFGDGSFSSEQHPIHQYADSGQYTVCLTVSNFLNPNLCSDIHCQDILTPSYYNLGGLTWAGGYPLNNPVFSNDTGIVFLYRLSDYQIHMVESKIFYENGYYWFTNLVQGNYLVKVGLTRGSTHYGHYMPTYLGDHVNWGAALLINLQDNAYDHHIHLVPVEPIGSGQGKINGYLTFEGYEPTSYQDIGIILSDETNHPLRFTEPDPAGVFEFDDLPFGTYLVRADLAGRACESYPVTLSQANPLSGTVELTITEMGTYDINDPSPVPMPSARLFPNPARDFINLELESEESHSGSFTVVDILGKAWYSQNFALHEGDKLFRIDIAGLPCGVYMLKMNLSGHPAPITIKFIK